MSPRKVQKKLRLVQVENSTQKHNYSPRSDTLLIHRAMPSWFVAVEKLKDQLLANTEPTTWVPSFVKGGADTPAQITGDSYKNGGEVNSTRRHSGMDVDPSGRDNHSGPGRAKKGPYSVPHSVLLSALPDNIYLHKLDQEIGRIQQKYEILIVQRIRSVLLRTGRIDDQEDSGEEASFNPPQDNRAIIMGRVKSIQRKAAFHSLVLSWHTPPTSTPGSGGTKKELDGKAILVIRSERGLARKLAPLKSHYLIRICYARYADDLLPGIVGAVELLIEIKKLLAHFLQSGLNLWVGSAGSTTIVAWSTVEFLGTVIREVPPRTIPIQFLRELEKRLRVKHRIHITACHLRSAIHSKFRNLGNSIPIKELTKGMSGTGSLLDAVQLADTLRTAGVRSPQVSVLWGTVKHIRQGSRMISLCRDNLYQVRTIVDHQIRWSAIFTSAYKHKSSARNIIPKYSKDSKIVNKEGGKTLAEFPNSIELGKLGPGMTSALIWQVSSGSSESGNATSLLALESFSSSESLATFRAEIAAERMKLRFMLAYESRDYYNLPPQNNPGEYEGPVRDHLDQALNVPHYRNILDMEYFKLTVLERKGLLQDRLFNLMLGEQNLSRIMELSPYTNIRKEAYDFLEEANLERIEQMVQLHNFFFSMVVPRGTAAPILLKWFVGRDVPTGNSYAPRTEQKAESWSAKRERARRRKGQRLQPNGNEQGRNDKMRCPGHPHLEKRVEVFGPVALPVPPSSGGACVGVRQQKLGLKLSPYQRANS
uniref:Maturase, mitochondrial n=1 Tax=Tanacetum cinerariifolium TaxID=118510 RepID=A0A6L2JA58_TANCI|nr:maturase, mitochondrial [Tanacetum cinerariifolium]